MPVVGEAFVLIGKVIKPHGIKGEVCVDLYTDSPFVLEKGAGLYLCRPGQNLSLVKVAAGRPHQGRFLLLFDRIGDRNTAETLRGSEVFIHETHLPSPGEDEVYVRQIEGLTVFLEDGSVLGRVEQVELFSQQEVWVIRTQTGKEVLFPVAREFVPHIDLEAGTVTIAPPPGLLELYLGQSRKN